MEKIGIVESSVRVVSGTSFGALNAVMFASDGYEKAEAMWQNAAKLKISNVPITKLKEIYDILLTSGLSGVSFEQFLALFGHGLFAEKSFSEFLDEHIDLSKMRESIEHIFIGATRFPTVEPVYYDLLRSPAALFHRRRALGGKLHRPFAASARLRGRRARDFCVAFVAEEHGAAESLSRCEDL